MGLFFGLAAGTSIRGRYEGRGGVQGERAGGWLAREREHIGSNLDGCFRELTPS